MRLVFSTIFILLILNTSAQTKEDKWNAFVTNFENALNKRDKSKLISLVAPKLEGEGLTNVEWVTEILSNTAELSKIKKTLLAKTQKGVGHDKMKCYQALCLYFDYKNNNWLLADAFED